MGEVLKPSCEKDDYPECPECGYEEMEYVGEDYDDGDSNNIRTVHIFECPKCGEELVT